MEITTCPHCKIRMVPKDDGTCISCSTHLDAPVDVIGATENSASRIDPSRVRNHPSWEKLLLYSIAALLAFFASAVLLRVYRYNFSDGAYALAAAKARLKCSDKFAAILSAMHAYEAEHGSFPPAFTVDASGRRMHSWRTLILPYLGEQEVFDQVDLSQPWDADVNRAARETVVNKYHCPSDSNDSATTRYFAVIVNNGTMRGEDGTKFADITDGFSSTILLVEGPAKKTVSWAEPVDIAMDEFLDLDWQSASSNHIGGTHVGMADGHVTFITSTIDKELLVSLLTASGGEPIGF